MPTLEERQEIARLQERQKAASQQVGSVRSFFTGEGRTEGYPELGTSGPSVPALTPGNPSFVSPITGKERTLVGSVPFHMNPAGTKMATAYATQVDPEAIADIAVKTLKEIDPDISKGKDKFGNTTVTLEGQTYYVNAPGVSEADLFQTLGLTGAFAPAAKAGSASRTILSRMLRTGVLSTGTSAGLDVLGGQMGSEQGVSGTRAAVTGLTAGALEGLAPVVKSAWRTIFRQGAYFDPATGQLTQKGAQVAKEAGLDPAMMERRLAEAFAKEAIDEPIPALAKTRAYTQAYDVPFTRGQQLAQTGIVGQSAREEAMRHGTAGFGDIGAAGMKAADKRGAAMTREAAEGVTGRLAGRAPPVASEAEAGEIVQRGVTRIAKRLDDAISDAYSAAGERQATLKDLQGIKTLMSEVDDALKTFDLDPQLFPATNRNLKLVQGQLKSKNPITVSSLETLRRKIRNNINAASSKADAEASRRLLKSFDDWEEAAIDNALFEGDDDALRLLKRARRARVEKRLAVEQSDKFDDAGRIIETLLAKDPSPEQTVNYLFGMGRIGNKQTTQAVMERLKRVFGEGSPEWNAVREAGWLRLMNTKQGVIKKPQQFVSDFDEAMNRHPSLIKEMFSDDEVKMMRAIRDIMDMRIPPGGAVNPSKTGWTLMRGMRDLVRRAGTGVTFRGHHFAGGGLFTIGRMMPVAGPGFQQKALKEATTQIPRPPPSAPPFVSAGTGAANIADPEGRLRRKIPGVP